MAKESIKVLHIDAGHEWRGGQQQAAYLLENMVNAGYSTKMMCPAGSPMQKRCLKKNLPVSGLRLKSRTRLKDARHIARLCREEKIDIIHAHCSHSLTIALLSRLLYRTPKIVASRRVDFHVKKPIVGAFKYKTKWVDKIICVSDAIKNIMINDGLPAQKLVTVRSGVDLHKFDDADPAGLREEFSIPDDHLIFVTVAALVGHKDYPTLLRAASTVLEQTKKVTFLAVGDGPNENALTELANELGVTENFKFVGYRKDVGRFLKLADIFVLASKTEGLGTSLLDAGATTCAIVATRAGGIPEIVKNGDTGLLVPKQQPEALAEAILELIYDSAECERLAQNALDAAQENSHGRTFERTIEIYQHLQKI
jgi:L-malate glycosyltransferase